MDLNLEKYDLNNFDNNITAVTLTKTVSPKAADLRRHLKTHSGEKSNKCQQCDFVFCNKSALSKHLKTHSGTKSNKCDQCEYSSHGTADLMKHMKIHRQEKPNQCKQCAY